MRATLLFLLPYPLHFHPSFLLSSSLFSFTFRNGKKERKREVILKQKLFLIHKYFFIWNNSTWSLKRSLNHVERKSCTFNTSFLFYPSLCLIDPLIYTTLYHSIASLLRERVSSWIPKRGKFLPSFQFLFPYLDKDQSLCLTTGIHLILIKRRKCIHISISYLNDIKKDMTGR